MFISYLVSSFFIVIWPINLFGFEENLCYQQTLDYYKGENLILSQQHWPWNQVWFLSDREGHGHKAVVYKSHFPPLRHSVVTETPADTLANKPCLTKDQALCSLCPHDMVAARIKHWDLSNISLGCVTHCQSIGRVERSSLRDCLFTLRLLALSFMWNKCAC